MMRLYKIIPLISLTFLLIFQNSINTGCTKPQDIPAVDTIIITPPPPPVNNDTVSLVRKLDELTSLYPGYGINKERSFSFYYDAQKRLTSVGIKVYPLYVTDTFTTRLEYIGNSKFPYRIIMPAINVFSPPSYDTTWFFYAANGKLQKDSSYERWLGGPEREPFYRIYSYPDSNTAKIDWYWIPAVSANLTLMRRDTVKFNATGRLDFIKAVYLNDPIRADGAYAKAEAFTFSQIVNPLSKLNISGTPYALIYTEVKKELLG
ncbi:hypothetical protein, partial [Ferruginibacter sp.]